MKSAPKALMKALTIALLLCATQSAHAADDPRLADHILGKATAPVTVDEYASLTCSHCAFFTTTILPDLEKKYVDTGKVKFILHDFPLNGPSFKAAALSRCMPAEQYYPFVKTLYKNIDSWGYAPDPDALLIQYAKLGGLSETAAKACLNDTGLQDQIVAKRNDAAQKYNINATPTFLINGGMEKIEGAKTVEEFSAVFDRFLAMSH